MVPQTDADRFIFDQLRPALAPDEPVIACAYLAPVLGGSGVIGSFVGAATLMAAFAVLTDRRLLLIRTRIGAFKPLLENHGVESIDRSAIRGVHFVPRLPRRAPSVLIELGDGRMLHYLTRARSTDVSTQAEFMDQLARVFGDSAAAARIARNDMMINWGGIAVGIALAGAYLWFRLH